MIRTGLVVGAVLLFATGTTQGTPTTSNVGKIPEKGGTCGAPTYEGRLEGETIETAYVVPLLPFYTSGNTCPFLDDYDEICPYWGSTAPDVVYRYDAIMSCALEIDLCYSGYDTKLYVYENTHTPGSPLACNDDAGCGMTGFQSRVFIPEIVAGSSYYIVVDGYGDACGNYELYIQDYHPCVGCPSDALIEDEPGCIDPENDTDNGGCNSDPPVFDILDPSDETIEICGTSGTYYQSGSQFRDTDWYQIDLASETAITFSCVATFDLTIGFVDGREGCSVPSFYTYASTWACGVATLTETLPTGTWWLWVGPTSFANVPCGAPYLAEVEGYSNPTPVRSVSWGAIKALHR